MPGVFNTVADHLSRMLQTPPVSLSQAARVRAPERDQTFFRAWPEIRERLVLGLRGIVTDGGLSADPCLFLISAPVRFKRNLV